MMNRTILISLLAILLLPVYAIRAQTTAAAIESLTVDLWPDFDRAAVLVLLTGELPDNTPLPATLTVPLPETADFNVVARIDSSDNMMRDDIDYSTGDDSLTFTTPDTQFRVEYYLPYSVENGQRSFSFTWLANLSVNQLQVNVQQPTAADSLLTEPPAIDVFTGEDGFTYHVLPEQIVPAGQPFSVRVEYAMSGSQLSAQRSSPSIEDAQTTGFSGTASPAPSVDWPVIVAIAGGIILLIALTWQIATARASSRPRKPRPVRAVSQPTPQYCHICGQSLQKGDKFCRECGTVVKGTK